MKRILRKTTFVLFLAVILCLGTVLCSAAEGNYEINIYAQSMSVGVRELTTLSAEVKGVELQPEISWSSSDTSIATVEPTGIVKGLKVGSTEITATATVGDETVSAVYPIYVVKKDNPINSYLEKHNILSFQYSYDYGGYHYANDKKAWQKDFGFARLYDYAAPFIGMEYDYARVFFTYDGQDFLLELWKGHYGPFLGSEIGIYNRDASGLPTDYLALYNASSEKYWPTMDMELYHQEKEGDAPEDYKLLFKRPVDKYWWCTGFVPGTLRELRPADELKVEATLTFNDSEMAACVARSLRSRGFKQCTTESEMTVDSFCHDGADITVSWQNITESQYVDDGIRGQFVNFAAKFVAAIVNVFWFIISVALSI